MDLEKSVKIDTDVTSGNYYPRGTDRVTYTPKYTSSLEYSAKDYDRYKKTVRERIASGYYTMYDSIAYSDISKAEVNQAVNPVDTAYSRWASLLMKVGMSCKLDGENLCIIRGSSSNNSKIEVAFSALYDKNDFAVILQALDNTHDPIGTLADYVERSSLEIFFNSDTSVNTLYSVMVALKFIA